MTGIKRRNKTAIVGVDPGLRVTGLAALDLSGALVDAYMLRASDLCDMINQVVDVFRTWPPDVLAVVEWPRIYPRTKQNPNDLRALCAVAGAVCTQAKCKLVEPRAWKGTLKKTTHHERLASQLTPDEISKILSSGPRHLHHNVWDAVGLALYGFDRLGVFDVSH